MTSLEDSWSVVIRLPEHASFYNRVNGLERAVSRNRGKIRKIKVITAGNVFSKWHVPRKKFKMFVRELVKDVSWKPDPEGIPAFIAGLATVNILPFTNQYEERFKYVYAAFGCLPNNSVEETKFRKVVWQDKPGRDLDERQIGVATFCLAAFVSSSNGWHVARTYLYFRDFLADQVKVSDPSVPRGILDAAQELLGWACGLKPNDKLEACVSVSHLIGLPNDTFIPKNTRVRLIRIQGYHADVSSEFYGAQPPTQSHEGRGVFHVNGPNLTISFGRDQVSPRQLKMTMRTLPYMSDVRDGDWRIVYNEKTVYLILTLKLWKRIVYGIAPSMTLWDHYVGKSRLYLWRTVDYSVAPFLAHALCYGDLPSKLAACRGLVAYTTMALPFPSDEEIPRRLEMLPAIFHNLDIGALRRPYDPKNHFYLDNNLKFDRMNGCFYAGLVAFSDPGTHKFMTRAAYEALGDIPGALGHLAVHDIGIGFARAGNYPVQISSTLINSEESLDEFYKLATAIGTTTEQVETLFSGIQLEQKQAHDGLLMKRVRSPFVRDQDGENEWVKRSAGRPSREDLVGRSTVRICAELERLSTVQPKERIKAAEYAGLAPEVVVDDQGNAPDLLIEKGVPISKSFPAIVTDLSYKTLDAHPDLGACLSMNLPWTIRYWSDFISSMDYFRWSDGTFVGHIDEPESDIRLDRTPVSTGFESFLHDRMDDRSKGRVLQFKEVFSEAMPLASAEFGRARPPSSSGPWPSY